MRHFATMRAGLGASLTLAVAFAPSAQAAPAGGKTQITGEGSPLPANVYLAELATENRVSTDVFDYAVTASNAGETALVTNKSTAGIVPVAFGATDYPLDPRNAELPDVLADWSKPDPKTRLSDIDTGGPLIQLPMLVFGVAITYTDKKVKSDLVLTDTDLCGVLSGKILTWDGSSGVAGDVGIPSAKLLGAKGPFTVHYRADKSITSDVLTTHLHEVCTDDDVPKGFAFKPTYDFASLFAALPATFTGEKGAEALAKAMLPANDPEAIGYITPDYTDVVMKPVKGFGKQPAALLLNGMDKKNYKVTYQNISAGNNAKNNSFVTPPVKAKGADQTQWVVQAPEPETGYPLVGETQWLLPTCFADNKALGMRSEALITFLRNHYTSAAYKMLANHAGFAEVSDIYAKAIQAVFLSNASGYNLNIGNRKTSPACTPLLQKNLNR